MALAKSVDETITDELVGRHVRVEVVVKGEVVAISRGHGPAILLELDQRDYTDKREVWLSLDEIGLIADHPLPGPPPAALVESDGCQKCSRGLFSLVWHPSIFRNSCSWDRHGVARGASDDEHLHFTCEACRFEWSAPPVDRA